MRINQKLYDRIDFSQFKTISSPDTTSMKQKNKYSGQNTNLKLYLNAPSTKQTIKKKTLRHKHFRNYSLQQLKNQLVNLSDQQELFLNKQRFDQVSIVQNQIKIIQKQFNNACILKVKQQHQKQKKVLFVAHKRQLKHFQSFWNQIFQQFQNKSQAIKYKIQRQIENKVRKDSQNLDNKINKDLSARKRKLLIKFSAKKCLLIKNKRYEELASLLNQQKKEMKVQQREQSIKYSNSMILQQQKLQNQFKIKSNSLKQRLTAAQNQKLIIFRNEKVKLQKKYSNIMNQMLHQQQMEINSLKKQLKSNHSRAFSSFK